LLNVPPAAVYKPTRRPQMKLVTGSLAPVASMPVTLGSMQLERDYTAAP
jgi:phosphatidylethanolamine/phosphatidyl-N-methylethanolamine N-methyltransferase